MSFLGLTDSPLSVAPLATLTQDSYHRKLKSVFWFLPAPSTLKPSTRPQIQEPASHIQFCERVRALSFPLCSMSLGSEVLLFTASMSAQAAFAEDARFMHYLPKMLLSQHRSENVTELHVLDLLKISLLRGFSVANC